MADLEELLIKVNSELGDMGGIDSAIEVLQTLKDISDKASRGADSLSQLANAFSTLNKEGKNTQGIQNLKSQVTTLTGVLDQLANHTKDANKTIKQLGDLGEALQKFAGLSESLKGLDGISKGVNDMVSVLGALGGLGSVSQKATASLKSVANIEKESQKAMRGMKSLELLRKSGYRRNKTSLGLENVADDLKKEFDNAEKIKRILVVGSRSFSDYERLAKELDKVAQGYKKIEIVSGGAKGADALAKRYAKERGFDYKEFSAQWDKYGKSAGYKRNEEMHEYIAQFDDRKVVAFWDGVSKGTQHSFDLAKKYNNELELINFNTKEISNNSASQAPKIVGAKFNLGKGDSEIKAFADSATTLKQAMTDLSSINQGIESLRKLGEAIHTFNGLDDNVKALKDVAIGIQKLLTVADFGDQITDESFSFIPRLKQALDTLASNSSGYENIGRATEGLANLIGWLDKSNNMDLSKLDALKDKMLELNTGDFKGTSFELGKALTELNEAFANLHSSGASVIQVIGAVDEGFTEATSGLYNVREQIEIISQDFDAVLSPVLNSRLIEILETFRSLNDSYKNVSGIAQGLGTLLDSLWRINGATIDTTPVEDLLYALKQLADSNLPEEVAKKFEKFEGVSDAMARLFNAMKYFAIPLDPNQHTVFGYLKQEITKFNEDIKGKFDETRNLLYGFKGVFEALQKDASAVPENNLFTVLKKQIEDLKSVGGEGGNLKVIGNLLNGISSVARAMQDGKGLNQESTLFEDIKKQLDDLYAWSIKANDMISNFSKIANLLQSITNLVTALSQGAKFDPNDNMITNIIKAIKGFDDSVLAKADSMQKVFTSIGSMARAMQKLFWANTQNVSGDLEQIKGFIGDIAEFNGKLQGIEKPINTLSKLMTAISDSSKNVSVEDNALKAIKFQIEEIAKLAPQMAEAEKAISNLSKLVEIVGTSSKSVKDVNALSRIADSIKNLKDGVGEGKELATLASNLSKLVEVVGNTKLDGRVNNAIDTLYKSIKKFDDLQSDKGKLATLAKDMSKLVTIVAENNDKITADNAITRLVESLRGFKDITEQTKGLHQTLNAIEKMLKVVSDASIKIPEENPLTQLKNILLGFKDVTSGVKGLDSVIKSMLKAIEVMKLVNGTQGFTVDKDNNPFVVLKAQLEQFKDISTDLEGIPKILKSFRDFIKDFDVSKNLKIDATPITSIIQAVGQAQGKEDAINNFKAIFSAIGRATKKDNGAILQAIADAMRDLSGSLEPFASAGKLQSLIDIANAMVKMKDIDLDKFREMAVAIREIMSALGSVNGSNNTIKITLDERGIVNAEHDIQSLHRTWEEFEADVMQEIQTINIDGMFDFSGTTKELRAELKKAEQALKSAEKEVEKWKTSMTKTEQIKGGEEGAREVDAYRRAFQNYQKASAEAKLYKDAVSSLNSALASRNGYELDNDAQGYRLRKNLTDERKRIIETLEEMQKNAPQLQVFGDKDEQQEVIRVLNQRVEDIDGIIEKVNNELENMDSSLEGIQERTAINLEQWKEMRDEVAKTSAKMNKTLGESFTQFGSLFKNSKSESIKGIGELFGKLGGNISSGKANLGLNTKQLASLTKVAGKVAIVVGAITLIVGAIQKWYHDMEKLKESLMDFTRKVIEFSKTLLSKVIGAFNAVAGAVGKMVSIVHSGAEVVASAIRKIGQLGQKIVSIFAKVGGALAPAIKGIKLIASLITPRIVKTLVNSEFSLKNIVKHSHALSKLMKTATRWLSTMSRMLMRRTITAFFNQIKQAFEDLAVYEKNAGVELLQFNTNVSKIFSALRRGANQWMGAFEPLINAVTPTILNFLNNVQAMGENVAKFMAILTGQPYYIRAKQFYEDYGQSVEDTKKKVKNLTNGLDELNILTADKDTDDGIKPEDMFEYVPVDGTFEGIKVQIQEILDKIKDWLRNIDWDWIKELLRGFAERLMEILNTIFRDLDLAGLLGKTLAEIINSLFEFINEAIHDLDWKALGKWIAEFFKGILENFDWELIRDTVSAFAKGLAQLWNEIFADKQLWTDIGETVAHVINDVIVEYLDSFAWNFNFANMADSIALAIKTALEKIDWSQIFHMVEGWMNGIVAFFNDWARDADLWKDIGKTLNNVINLIISAFNTLGDMDFKSLAENIKKGITELLSINWDEFAEALEKWVTNIANVINTFLADEEFLTTITTNLAQFVNNIISALDSLISKLQSYDIGKALATALINGLASIDWNTIFTLPANAINALSNALRGLLDSIPEDFNLGKWLTDHLSLTLDGIDWETLEKNIADFATKIKDWITGVLQNEDFWAKAGTATAKVIKIGLDFVFELFNINGEDLGNAITNYINNFVKNFNVGSYIVKTVDILLNIFTAINVVLTGVDWDAIGDQIAQGIVDAINRVFENLPTIVNTIQNAFKVFSKLVSKILSKMIEDGSFTKIGEIIGKIFLAIIEGIALFFEENLDTIIKGIEELGKALKEFLEKNKAKIVNALNTIIDSIVEIISSFLDAKSGVVDAIADIVRELHLGNLFGMMLHVLLTELANSLTMDTAIWDALTHDMENLGKQVAKGLKKLLKAFFKGLLGELLNGNFMIAPPIQGLINAIKRMFGLGESGLFGKKKAEIPVDIKDETDLEDSDVTKEAKEKITIEDTEWGTITVSKINVDEINAKVLNVIDIFADKLTVKEIETENEVKEKKMDEFFGGEEFNAQGGVLGARREKEDFDTITARLLEITEKITAPLLEIAEKITAPLIEVAEKITTPLLEVTEKITTPLLEVTEKITTPLLEVKEKITTPLLEATKIVAETMVVATITATLLTVPNIESELLSVTDIVAETLKVGTIEGEISGGSGTGIGNLSFGGYGLEGLSYDYPLFEIGERWSDISGNIIESAEDFVDILGSSVKLDSDALEKAEKEIAEGISTGVVTKPKNFADNDNNAQGGTLTNDNYSIGQAKQYLIDALGNENSANAVLGNLVTDKQESSDWSENGYADFSMSESELSKLVDDIKGNSELWSELQNASSVKKANQAFLSGYEGATVLGNGANQESVRWFNSEDIAKNVKAEEIPERQDDGTLKNVDELKVVEEDKDKTKKKGIGAGFLDGIIPYTDYTMATVYNIIDTWLGRIWKLFESFEVPPILEELIQELDLLYADGEPHLDVLKEIDERLGKISDQLDKLIKDGIECHCSCEDAFNELKDAIDDWIDCAGDTGHLDNNTQAKSANTKAVEAQTKAIRDLVQGGLSNITCNCNCGGNCGSCAMGGGAKSGEEVKGSEVVRKSEKNYGVGDLGAITDTLNNGADIIENILKDIESPVKQNQQHIFNPTSPTRTDRRTYTPTTTTTTPTTRNLVGHGISGKNDKIVWQNANGTKASMFANVGGQLIRLTDELSDSMKKLIKSGAYKITDSKGNALTSKDFGTMLNYLRDRWKDTSSNDREPNKAYYLQRNGGDRKALYATLNGKKIKLSDFLDPETKLAIANGIFHDVQLFTEDGQPIVDDEALDQIRDMLIANDWTSGKNFDATNKNTDATNRNTGATNANNNALKDTQDALKDTNKALEEQASVLGARREKDNSGETVVLDNNGTGKPNPYTSSSQRAIENQKAWQDYVDSLTNGTNGSGSGSGGAGTGGTGTDDGWNEWSGMDYSYHTVPDNPNYSHDLVDVDSGWLQNGGNQNGGNQGNNGGNQNGGNQNNQDQDNGGGNQSDNSGNQGDSGADSQEQKKEEEKNYNTGLPMIDRSILNSEHYDDWVSEVEDYRSKAESLLNTVKAHGDEALIQKAQREYDDLMTNKGFANADPYKHSYKQLEVYAKQADPSLAEKEKEEQNNAIPITRPAITGLTGEELEKATKAKQEEDAKVVGEWREKAKTLLDNINSKGDDTQKAQAKAYYDSLMQNKGSLDTSPYKYNLDKLQKLSDEATLKNGLGDLSQARIGINGGVWDLATIGSMSKEDLARIIYGKKDKNGQAIYFFKKGNRTGNSANATDRLTDAESIDKIKAYLRTTYNVSEDDLPKEATKGNTDFKSLLEAGSAFASNLFSSSQKYPIESDRVSLLDKIKSGARKLTWAQVGNVKVTDDSSIMSMFNAWYDRFQAKGYKLGGLPNSGDIFVARENGSPEFVGSFGNNTAVANNDQIVTAVANGVAMANDSLRNAIENQTNALENAIDRKNLDVQIGDRQIAEANRRGEEGLGQYFVK